MYVYTPAQDSTLRACIQAACDSLVVQVYTQLQPVYPASFLLWKASELQIALSDNLSMIQDSLEVSVLIWIFNVNILVRTLAIITKKKKKKK